MKTSMRGLAEIAGHEGIVPAPYKDSVGVWTWGIGHTASAGAPDPSRMVKGDPRPIKEVMDQFAKDIAKYEDRVNGAVKVPVTQSEFDALVSFDFNTGGITRAQLTKHLNEGNRTAAAAAFDGWHRPPEIIGRRNAEKRLFRDGVYSNGGMATVYPADSKGRVQWSKGERVNVLSLLGPAQPDDPGPDAPSLEDVERTYAEAKATPEGRSSALPALAVASLVGIGAFLWRRFGTVGLVAALLGAALLGAAVALYFALR